MLGGLNREIETARALVICMCASDGNEKEKKRRRWGPTIDMAYYEGSVAEASVKLKTAACGAHLLSDSTDDWN